MSSTTIEQIRQAREESDAIEAHALTILEDKPAGAKAKVTKEHAIAQMVGAIIDRTSEIEKLYADSDEALKEELEGMRGANVFSNFYEQLKETKEYHARFGERLNNVPPAAARDALLTTVTTCTTEFSGEEVWGKYLDLGPLHDRWVNLKAGENGGGPHGNERYDFNEYLANFYKLGAVPESAKNAAYARYVADLRSYLAGYFARAQPLVDTDADLLVPSMEGFDEAFERGAVPGWPLKAAAPEAASGDGVDLAKFGSADELQALGGERLKRGLVALGLKCGGTAADRAARLFSVKGKKPGDIDPKLRAKPSKAAAAAPAPAAVAAATNGEDASGDGDAPVDRRRRLARLEREVEVLAEHLELTIEATRRRAERKQTQTLEELQLEVEEEEKGALPDLGVDGADGGADSDDEENAPIYNPKNLPLGWDGKPIPYWLYKLHGLDQAYVCETCGNYTYYGRRAFDRHFQEWRHSHGMRCLGIPNTKHFHGVVCIEDCLALWEQLKTKLDTDHFKAERDEEYEDTEGNVLNRATYEDLARQGLL